MCHRRGCTSICYRYMLGSVPLYVTHGGWRGGGALSLYMLQVRVWLCTSICYRYMWSSVPLGVTGTCAAEYLYIFQARQGFRPFWKTSEQCPELFRKKQDICHEFELKQSIRHYSYKHFIEQK